MNNLLITLDTKRRIDDNYNMHIEDNILTQEGIADYLGSEIKQWYELGLEPDKIYKVYRPREVLEKNKDTFNRLPVTFEHPDGMIERTQIPKEDIIGTAGEKAYVDENGNLRNSITFWDNQAVEKIINNEIKGLSCGYVWDVEIKKGTFNNEEYDLIITGISGNHIALTENPRVKGSMIADSNKGGVMSRITELQTALSSLFKIVKDSETKPITLEERLAVIDEAFKKGDVDLIKDMIKAMMSDEEEFQERKEKTQSDDEEVSQEQKEKTQSDDDKPLTLGEFKQLMEELKNNAKKEQEMEMDEENKASEIAKDCAKKLGYGNVVGNSIQIADQILKDKGITVDSRMSRDNRIAMLLGLTQAMLINDSSSKKDSIIIDSTRQSDPQIEALLNM